MNAGVNGWLSFIVRPPVLALLFAVFLLGNLGFSLTSSSPSSTPAFSPGCWLMSIRGRPRWLALLPLTAMVGDLSENFHFAHLACRFDQFDNEIGSWYWTAVLSSATKSICFALATLALIVGGIGRLCKTWTSAVAGDSPNGAV